MLLHDGLSATVKPERNSRCELCALLHSDMALPRVHAFLLCRNLNDNESMQISSFDAELRKVDQEHAGQGLQHV